MDVSDIPWHWKSPAGQDLNMVLLAMPRRGRNNASLCIRPERSNNWAEKAMASVNKKATRCYKRDRYCDHYCNHSWCFDKTLLQYLGLYYEYHFAELYACFPACACPLYTPVILHFGGLSGVLLLLVMTKHILLTFAFWQCIKCIGICPLLHPNRWKKQCLQDPHPVALLMQLDLWHPFNHRIRLEQRLGGLEMPTRCCP